ncbi:MAG: DUF47 family protein [Negativicutes bacterium]|jgi:hypothetical protein
MFSFLKPREDKFFVWFLDSAKLSQQSSELLIAAFDDLNLINDNFEKISHIDYAAIELSEAVIDKLNQSFITPIDREEIFAINKKLKNLVGLIKEIMDRLVVFRIKKPIAGAVEMSRLLASCVDELFLIFKFMQSIKKNREEILEQCYNIIELEDEGDRIYNRELASLFANCADPIEVIKWKEVFELLENALDHCDDFAHFIRGLVMKYA